MKTLPIIRLFTLLSLLFVGTAAVGQRVIRTDYPVPIASQSRVTTDNIRTPIKTDNQIYNLTPDKKSTTVLYYDGLGRNSHVVQAKASPTGSDVIQLLNFDAYGRVSKSYLPFTFSLAESFLTDQLAFYNNPNDRLADDGMPFAVTNYEPSPVGRMLEQGAPGQAWQPGTTHTTRYVYTSNTAADQVRQFETDGSSTQFFAANKLFVTEVTDADQHKSIAYTDKNGRTLLLRKPYGDVINGVTVAYLETYYIYDDFDRIKYIISPKAVAALQAGAWSLTVPIKDQFVFEFVYDKRGRTVEKKVPGAGWAYIVYDQLNRPVLVQQANLRAANQWHFIKYDSKNRIVQTGIYTDAVNNTRALMQAVLDNKNYDATDLYYETRLTGTTDGYSNVSFPSANITLNGANYYDDYDFDNNGSPDYPYANQSLGAEEPVPTAQTRGALTGTRKRILGTSNWLIEVVYYDRYGRVVQKRNNNQLNMVVEDAITLVLDFEGKVLKKKTFQKTSPTQSITVVDLFDYDPAGRVLRVKQNINNAATTKVIAQYKYNELGQAVEKNLSGMGATGTEGFLQSVDIKYNIRGWLTHINNSELKYDKVANDDNDDVFGLELVYDKADAALANVAKFNGNISAVKWQHNDALNANQPKRQRAYAFDYYNNDQLKHANYKAWGGTAWTAEAGGFDMKNLSYDHNGNILGYERYSKASDAAANEKVDQLTYTYAGNVLTKVEDVATPIAIGAGFANGANLATEYTYDANGNLTGDQNKGITLAYNELNKTVSVAKAGQGSLTYEYDANGTRLSSTIVQGANSTKQSFINGFVYQDGTLLYFGMAEGKVNRKTDGSFEYEYMVTDHQGNVRVTFKELVQVTTYTATMEDNGTATMTNPRVAEMQNFQSLFDVEQPQVGPWLNKTAATTAVPSPNRAAYLTGLANRKVGPGISLKVKPGDALHMEAYGKFLKPSTGGFNNVVVAGLAAAFGGSFAGLNGLEGSSPVSGIYNSASSIIGTNYGGSQTDRPRAYINYLLFDNDFNFVDAGWDRIDAASGYLLNQENTVPWDKVQLDITVAKAGYVYIYLSNESEGTAVYFDDMAVTHTARIPQVTTANDYYPFGLRMEGVVNNTSLNNATGQYTYNGGSAWQNGAGNFANYLSTPLREYDPVLGRFNGIDIMAAKYAGLSPYVFALNNPVYWSDPSGADVTWGEIEAIVAGLLRTGHGGSWHNTSLSDGGAGGGGGGGGGVTIFGSFGEAFAAGVAYNNLHNSWGSTSFGAVAKYGFGMFTYNFNGGTYGGNYHTENGRVVSVATSSLVQGSNGGWLASGETEIFEFGAISTTSGWDKFWSGFGENNKSYIGSRSSLSNIGFMWADAVGAAVRYGDQGRSMTELRNVVKAGKFFKYAGAAGGALTTALTYIEAKSDGNISNGDMFKVGMGVLQIGLAFTPVGWGVLAYNGLDFVVGVATGTNITDRIANGIDSMSK